MNVRPVDLPLLRHELLEAQTAITRAGLDGFDWLHDIGPIRDPRKMGAYIREHGPTVLRLAREECDRLQGSVLFFVSEPMGRVATEAAKGLPNFELMPEDLPSETGFMFFESPLSAGDDKAPVVASSWSCTAHGSASIAWYFEKRFPLSRMDPKLASSLLIQSLTSGPRIQVFNLTSVPFGPGELLSVGGMDGRTRPVSDYEIQWLRELKTIWLLMVQPIASVSDAVYARADRRRIERVHQDPPAVRVITLRRPATPSGTGDSDREYHHQWIVRGHWRQQWYPSRGVNRPVWIAPHVKGPEGAPMLGGEKVYSWTR